MDVVALDDFFAAHDLEKIYYVSIDTEGFDPLVLEGMRGAISRRQVSIIEFEVNTLGFWSRKRLILEPQTPHSLSSTPRATLAFGLPLVSRDSEPRRQPALN